MNRFEQQYKDYCCEECGGDTEDLHETPRGGMLLCTLCYSEWMEAYGNYNGDIERYPV